MDIRTNRISNRLILLGLLTGLIYRVSIGGILGILIFILHITIPVILFFILFLMRALGAGDIKLLSVVFSICNYKEMISVLIAAFAVGAVMSLMKMLVQNNLYARLSCFWGYIRALMTKKTVQQYFYGESRSENTIHFSISIFIGYLISLGVCH